MNNDKYIDIANDIILHLQNAAELQEAENVNNNTLKFVDALTSKFNITRQLWYKDKKKTLAMIALFSIILALPGGVLLSPMMIGIKDSIANGMKPSEAIANAYKKLPTLLNAATKKSIDAIAKLMQKIIDMPKPIDKALRMQLRQLLIDICSDAKQLI